jgi:peptide deformylase
MVKELVIEKLNIKTYPDSILRDLSQDITCFDEELEVLADSMIETMNFHEGVGLAGPQVGVSKNIVVFKGSKGDVAEDVCLINPVILETKGTVSFDEGCLSLPGINGTVKRSLYIKVSAFDIQGNEIIYESDKFSAVILQHEIDHLNGKLFIDYLSLIRRKLILKKYNKKMKRK